MIRTALGRPPLGYAVALIAPGGLTLGILTLRPSVDASAGYAYLYLSVVILVALAWGLGAAILSAVCAVGILDYYFIPPRGTLTIGSPVDLENLILFMFAAIVVGALADARRRKAMSLLRVNADLKRKTAEAEEGRRSAVELARVSAQMEAVADADRLKTELLANVSHELRSPLAAIVGVSSALADPEFAAAPDEVRQHGATINKEGVHLSRLVADLLDMSQLEAGTVTFRMEPVDALESLYSATERANIVDPGLKLRVEGDSFLLLADDFRLQQVLHNLIENAARYRTEVEVRTAKAPGHGRLEVLDHGPGVPEVQRERIFERFYRGDPETREDAGKGARGSGLGLAISRRLVEGMGGRIWCEPRPGGGSVFICQLPLAE